MFKMIPKHQELNNIPTFSSCLETNLEFSHNLQQIFNFQVYCTNQFSVKTESNQTTESVVRRKAKTQTFKQKLPGSHTLREND